MLCGEIRLVDLDPVRDSEANKPRLAALFSSDRANIMAERLGRGVIKVVSLTSNVELVFPCQVLLPAEETGLRVDCKTQAEQMRSVADEQVGDAIGRVPPRLMAAVDKVLRSHLRQ
nr:type II toxin-antitoxin system PemK/MazF family toxin [uncultured Serinicoccus sp.]